MDECVFCKIVKKEIQAQIIWENQENIAFLSIFPNTEGMTVVATKSHLPSDFFALKEDSANSLISSAREVSVLLQSAFPDVGRVALIAEGMGVDHAHVKLIPLHGTVDDNWREQVQKQFKTFDLYPGYVASYDAPQISGEELNKVAEKIRNSAEQSDQSSLPSQPMSTETSQRIGPLYDDPEPNPEQPQPGPQDPGV